jgi:hypothetical protein
VSTSKRIYRLVPIDLASVFTTQLDQPICATCDRTLLANLDISTGRVIAHVRKRSTSKDFLVFLDSVVREYPNQRLVIVLDSSTPTPMSASGTHATHG